MELTIIVVNYNVQYFLRLCLESLRSASAHLETEIIVVDNASEDGSVDMVRKEFPEVKLIANSENIGFGRASNQGLEMARGKYVLFINPDTIIGESLLPAALKVFDEDDQIGAVGICLLDGQGQVLRESKRSIPTLWSAFTKFSGLSELFRHTSLFNHYYFPSLQYDEIGDIDVLPGAFMLIRKSVLDEINGFDSRFFMYAEDIDLSYRISRAGYKIRYNGGLKAIHFKGESTKKSLLTYTNTFFHSMRLFIDKYTGELYSVSVSWLLQVIVRSIQRIQEMRRRWFPERNRSKKRLPVGELFVLSDHPSLVSSLPKYLDAEKVHFVPVSGTDQAPFYLRYTGSYLKMVADISLILDIRSLSFDQITWLWIQQDERPYYIADGEKSFFISSHNKEKQGEVHTFG